MVERSLTKLVEEIAATALTLDPVDGDGAEALAALFCELQASATQLAEPVTLLLERCLEALDVIKASADEEQSAAAIEAILDAVCEIQEQAKRFPRVVDPRRGVSGSGALSAESPGNEPVTAAPSPTDASTTKGLMLPDAVDDELLREFLSTQVAALEELEQEILALERDGRTALRPLKGRIHTLKGEAGVLGLTELAAACHGVEDFLELPLPAWERADRLLLFKDWLATALAAYGALQQPQVSAAQLMAVLHGELSRAVGAEATPQAIKSRAALTEVQQASAAPTTAERAQLQASLSATDPQSALSSQSDPSQGAADVAAESAPPGAAAKTAGDLAAEQGACSGQSEAQARQWNEEDVALIGEFLQESDEGLSTVDQTLLDIEQDGVDEEKVNSLFRVFHTIKGVSAFLELSDVTSLSHSTETMLDRVRSGVLELSGGVLDLVFDATAMMRRLLAAAGEAVQQGHAVTRVPEVQGLIARLDGASVVTEGERPLEAADEAGAVPPRKLGEILVESGVVAEDEICEALSRQQVTRNRLGEELVRQGKVDAKQVAHALREQRKSATQGRANARIRDTVKVDLERVDQLVEVIGELVIVEAMVVHLPEIAQLSSVRVKNYLGQLAKITRDLQDIGMLMRMVPVRALFHKMSRMVRDLGHKSGKSVRVEVTGEGTEMDRSMVEQIADPLVHLIRNAVDHGIERPQVRRAAGKTETGTIRLAAYHQGGRIVIEISDDGKGLDEAKILARARERGLVKEHEQLSQSEIFELIFAPGFSTADEVTEVSGRGVGMDVVKRNLDAMRGRVFVSSEAGRGTSIKLALPLTLAIIDGMVVSCGAESYIIPTLSIVESIKPDGSMLASLTGQRELINVRGEILPLLRLDQLLAIPGAKQDTTEALVVIVEAMGQRVGLQVDDVVTQQQVVIKNIGAGITGVRYIAGAAILSDGRVGLILNVEELQNLIALRDGRMTAAAKRAHGGAVRPLSANAIT